MLIDGPRRCGMSVWSCHAVCRSDRLTEPPDGGLEGITVSEQSGIGSM
jgi:hypothetical protein